VSFQVTFEAVK